jgi:XTP/dITP diphosphohydrolase
MHKLVLATSNSGKIREFKVMLDSLNLEVLPQSVFGLSGVDETGLTFVENALLKARGASLKTGLPALADDSGLMVDALAGDPGVSSARYAGLDALDQNNNDKLLSKLDGVPMERRTARFVCALVLLRYQTDPAPLICQASWEGIILTEPHGANGFGYDPIFWVLTEQRTSAQLASEAKNRLSHRGQAVTSLLQQLSQLPNFWEISIG